MELNQGAILPNNIVIKEQKKVQKETKSGIIIPATQKIPQMIGDVLLVGTGTAKEEMVVKPGMCVIVPPMSGQKFYLDEAGEEEFLLVPQTRVLFMWTPKPAVAE